MLPSASAAPGPACIALLQIRLARMGVLMTLVLRMQAMTRVATVFLVSTVASDRRAITGRLAYDQAGAVAWRRETWVSRKSVGKSPDNGPSLLHAEGCRLTGSSRESARCWRRYPGFCLAFSMVEYVLQAFILLSGVLQYDQFRASDRATEKMFPFHVTNRHCTRRCV